METTITLAGSDLVGGYNKLTSGIWGSAAGTVIMAIFTAIAVVLALALIIAGIMKGLGRQNQLVQKFCPSIGRVLIILLAIFFFAGPAITIPALLKLIDWFVNAFGGQTQSYLGI